MRLVGVAEAQTRQRAAGRSGRGAGAQAGRPTEAEARPGGGRRRMGDGRKKTHNDNDMWGPLSMELRFG